MVRLQVNCRRIQASFDERLDGRLDAAEQQRFDSHLGICAGCRAEWEIYEAAWRALARHESIEPSFGFVERTLRRLHQPESDRVPARWWRRPFALRWATTMAMVMAIGLASWTGWQHHQATKQAQIYASAQEVNFLGDDFDVIASLDQLDKGNSL